MSKVSLQNLSNLQNENTAVTAINANNAAITAAIENSVSRDGTHPNFMSNTLDMNSNRIINLPASVSPTEPLRKGDLDYAVASLEGLIDSATASQTILNNAVTATNAALQAATVVSGDIAAISSAFSAINFNNYGAKPATKGSGTATIISGAVVGTGTAFTTQFQVGDTVTVESAPITGAGYITSQPINGDFVGTVPWASLVTGFGGADFTALSPGDRINSPVYSSPFLPASKSWPVNNVISSTKLRTAVMMDPQIGAGSGVPYVIVTSNSGYVVFPVAHNKSVGDSITLSNTGNASLNGTYNITQVVSRGVSTGVSNAFIITTTGVPDGTYVTSNLTVTGVTSQFVTAVVASNVATLFLAQPHGLSVGDSFNMAGWTGGATGMNTTVTVSTIGANPDLAPFNLTIPTTGVADGVYSSNAVTLGTTWTYTPRARQATVATITDATHMTLTGLPRDYPAGTVIWKTPDNYAAFQAAVAASNANGLTLLIPSLTKTVQTPETRYYFKNNPTVTGQTDGKITNSNFNQSIIFEGNAKFILTQDNPSYCGFEFSGGTNAKFINWTVDTLYQTPWAPIISTFPFHLHLIGMDRPEVQSFTTNQGCVNSLAVEFCKYPRISNVLIQNCSGGLLMDNNVGFNVDNVTVINSADQGIAFYGAGLRGVEDNTGVASNLYVKNAFHGIALTECYGHIISNFYIEGTVGPGIAVGGSGTQLTNKNVFSNGIVKRAVRLGPAAHLNNQSASISISDAVATTFNNVHVRNAIEGEGWYTSRSFGTTGTVTLNNCSVYDVPGIGAYLSTYGDVLVNNFHALRTDDIGMFVTNNDTVRLNNIRLDQTARFYNGGTNYGPNNALVLNFNAIVLIDGLTLKDRTDTGYKIFERGTTGKVRIKKIEFDFQSIARPTLTIQTPTRVFIENSFGANVASGSTITPTGQVFHVTGTAAIDRIEPINGMQVGESLTIFPDAIFTWTTGNNILKAGTAVVNKALTMTYNGTNWLPSYTS